MCGSRRSRRRAWKGLAALLLAVACAACQSMRNPFDNAGNLNNPLVVPRTVSGVLVRPVDGMKDGAGLAAAMAAALRREEIPANVDAANSASYTLTARARLAPPPGGDRLAIEWYLSDAAGLLIGDHLQTVRRPPGRSANDAAYLRETAATEAPVIARMIAGRDAERVKQAPKVTVHEVDGAPGDGRIALRRALGYELKKAGYKVVDGLDADAVVLLGDVRLAPAGANLQRVRIGWTALAPDGAEIGTVAQVNTVPKGSLNGSWGTTALLAARAAVPGIARLMKKAAERAAPDTAAARQSP